MDFNLVHFDYSPWLLIFSAILGIGYAVFFYFKSRLAEITKPWQTILLGILRGVVVFVLGFLILGPIIQYFDSEVEEPRIVAMIDNTQSMAAPMIADSAEVYQSIQNNLRHLNAQFKVDTLLFSEKVEEGKEVTFHGKATDIDAAINYVKSRYEGIPLAGIVLMSDGIYNQGKNPIYSITGLNSPLYTIPYGDSTHRSDIKISQVLHNKIAYLGDEFPLEADIVGEKMEAQHHSISLYKINAGGQRQLIKTEKLEIKEGSFFNTVPFQVKASEVGVQHYQLIIPAVDGELTTVNNHKDIFIEVIDSRQKIAIIGSSPHPDIGALYAGLSSFDNYEVEKYILPDRPENLKEYDLAILHQVPGGGKNSNRLITALDNAEIPRLWVIGAQSDVTQFSNLQDVMEVRQKNRQNDEVQASANVGFTYFNLNEKIRNQVSLYPPLDVPFAHYILESGAQTLLYQVVGKISTENPLIAINDKNSLKEAVIVGEGIWRWKLYDFLENSHNENFNNLLSQMVKFLSVRKDLRKFIVESQKKIYEENEKVHFSANLYNDAYQALIDPSVKLTISSGERQYDYVFTPLSSNYSLDAGYFSPGTYSWDAETSFDGSQYRESGQFIVREVQKEYLNLVADYPLLRHLAQQTGGDVWLAQDDMSRSVATLKNSPYAKKVKFTTERNKPLISMTWIGGILAFLLLSEWLLRRLWGDY